MAQSLDHIAVLQTTIAAMEARVAELREMVSGGYGSCDWYICRPQNSIIKVAIRSYVVMVSAGKDTVGTLGL